MFRKFIVEWVVAPLIGMIILCVGFFIVFKIYITFFNDPSKKSTPPTSIFQSLGLRDDVSEIKPYGELAAAFNLDSKYTNVQRENFLNKIKGKVIIWEVNVYEVARLPYNKYKIQTQSALFCKNVSSFITLTAKDELQTKFIEEIKTDQIIRIKGVLTGRSTVRHLEIEPAILWYPGSNAKSGELNFSIQNTKNSIELKCD